MPVRLRLTLVFAAAMAVLLVAVGVFVRARLAEDLDAAIDQTLIARSADLAHISRAPPPPPGENDEVLLQLLGLNGRVRAAVGAARRPLMTPAEVRRATRGPWRTDRRVAGLDDRYRLLGRRLVVGGVPVVGVVGVTLGDRDDALASLRDELLVAFPFVLLVTAFGAYLLAGAALRPVDDLVRRLEAAVLRERRFVAEASHELRTPLGLLKTEIELALDGEASREELEAALRSAGDETDRLIRLANDLLLLARANGGRLPIERRPVRVATLLERVATRFAGPAEREGRAVRAAPSNGLRVEADETRLEQALQNLVDNALQHGSGTVELAAMARPGAIELHVLDGGRAAMHATGTGLGLAIVEAIATAHGGTTGSASKPGGHDAWIALPDGS
jgi:signal transduction histidine kinase